MSVASQYKLFSLIPNVTSVKLTALPPFVEVTLSLDDLRSIEATKLAVSGVIAEQFVVRRAMWKDLRKEQLDWVLVSLDEAQTELRGTIKKLSDAAPAHSGLIKLIRRWDFEVTKATQVLRESLAEIADAKAKDLGYDSAGEDRDVAKHEAMVALRAKAYPIILALISFLDDDDPARIEAQKLLDDGFGHLDNPALQRGATPELAL